jgi:hypothetical protein
MDATDRRPRRPWKISLLSATVLALELAFIRQVPAEVRIISYFTNLLLMAAFFGLGLGCIFSRRRLQAWLLPVGLALVAAFVYFGRGIVIYEGATSVHYWVRYEAGLTAGLAPRVPILPAAIAVFLFVATPFFALGQALAAAMDARPRLSAYAWDIAGSLAGTILFTLTSFLGVPPWVWPPAAGLIWALFFADRTATRVLSIAAGLVFAVFATSPHRFAWSPYYYVQYEQEPGGLRVWVNSSFHQFAVDFRDDPASKDLRGTTLDKFGMPYEIYRGLHDRTAPARVLILGAGTGNDVNVALRNEAKEITAVEIDPVILRLGTRLNATRPYADSRVSTRIDDARHFLRTAPGPYDLIVFGTLDSQTLLSGYSNIRLENYVYTREAFEDVRRLLAPRGMMVAYYSVTKPWLYGRIYATVRSAFGERVALLKATNPFLFNTVILASGADVDLPRDEDLERELSAALPATDDWPYLYLEKPTIAPIYLGLFASLLLLVAAAFALLRREHPDHGMHVNFLLLGVGFTLMESAAVVRFALFFGSTWIVSAVVFASVLLTIFLGNALVAKGRAPSLTWSWAGLCGAIAVNYLIPMQVIVAWPVPVRAAASAALIGVPVFFASICFSRLFSAQSSTGFALGINLVGAMAGGLLEYLSMAIGMRAVWLVVLAVYAAAWFATRLGERRLRASPAHLP